MTIRSPRRLGEQGERLSRFANGTNCAVPNGKLVLADEKEALRHLGEFLEEW